MPGTPLHGIGVQTPPTQLKHGSQLCPGILQLVGVIHGFNGSRALKLDPGGHSHKHVLVFNINGAVQTGAGTITPLTQVEHIGITIPSAHSLGQHPLGNGSTGIPFNKQTHVPLAHTG
jgi:hypothetical protein